MKLLAGVAVLGSFALGVDANSCILSHFEHELVPAGEVFASKVIGKVFGLDFSDPSLSLFFVDVAGVASDSQAVNISKVSNGIAFAFSSLTAGTTYSAKVTVGGSDVCATPSTQTTHAHAAIHLAGFSGNSGALNETSVYNVAGKRELTITGTGILPSPEALVRYRDASGNSLGLEAVPAQVEMSSSGPGYVIKTVTVPIPTPLNWKLACSDPANPVQSGNCIPDIDTQISLSINGGLSWSNALSMTFGYKKPVKVAFVFVGPVTDFGWTYQLNEGRVLLESIFGATVDASYYFEYLGEGEFESKQDNRGATISTGTPVPKNFSGVKNMYYDGFELMKRLCDEDFDMVFTGSFGLQMQTVDVSGDYLGCRYVGDGSDTSAGEYNTFFMNTGGFMTTPRMATGFAKIYQMRYLAGLVAGNELKTRKLKKELDGTYNADEPLCIGYIAAYPLPEVQRGINAFLIGCREVFEECIIRVVWSGVWHDGDVESEAAKFMWSIGKCEVITQHSDTPEPQAFYQSMGGAGIGYNSDTRKVVGDSVLTSAILNWMPVFAHYIEQVRDGKWDVAAKDPAQGGSVSNHEQIWPGVAEGAVKLAPYFSPKVPVHVQEMVMRKQAELETAKGDDAFRHIFCGNLQKSTLR